METSRQLTTLIENILRKRRVKRKLYERELRRNKGKFIVTCESEDFYSVFHINGRCLHRWGCEGNHLSLTPVDESDRLYYYRIYGYPFKSFEESKKYIKLYCLRESDEVYQSYVNSYHRLRNKRRIML